ncbi:SLAP domain-containing protein [Companilactobacillus sp. HBUAS56275]|uniref:SLAP domain-containing protein n=1 Tax=Companilactobacillus sp. HBUAS56275 TaxID=3109364 RepID=UPI002FEEF2E0
MKKYYGPIVLGLAALTLGATASQTTVHADGNDGEDTQVETPAKDGETETDNGDQTETPDKSAIQKDLDKEIASIDTKISSGNYKDAQITTLKNLKEEYTAKAAAATDDQTRDTIYSDLYLSLENVAYTVSTPTNAIVSGTKENITLSAQTVTLKKGDTEDIIIKLPSGYAPASENSSSSIVLKASVNKDGEVIFSGDIDKDNNLLITDTVTTDSLKKEIAEDSSLSQYYTSPDKADELAKLTDSYKQELTAIQDKIPTGNTDAKTLHALNDDITNVINKYTNKILLDRNTAQWNVPILKDGSVTFRALKSEYVTIKYSADGTKLTSAEITDKDGNKIKSNTKIVASIGLDSFGQPGAVENTNDPLPNTNSGNYVEPSKPETTQKKSVSDHTSTFYVLPNGPISLFDDNGNKATNLVLGKNSFWRVDKVMTLDGVTYLRVATNEWVKLADGLEVTPLKETVTTNKQVRLYTGEGKLITNRILGNNTAWLTDNSATINGQKMYRVATNEWISANDIK